MPGDLQKKKSRSKKIIEITYHISLRNRKPEIKKIYEIINVNLSLKNSLFSLELQQRQL